MSTAAHDFSNCKERYCIYCFYMYLAMHPEAQEEYELLFQKLTAPKSNVGEDE